MANINVSHLSLFYKILIYIEDNDRVLLKDLEAFGGKRQMLGALGRLEGLHYIERINLQTEEYLVLSEKGDAVLASLLASIPEQIPTWDQKWRLILFDVPESKRTIRQMLRLKLFDLGARMLQSSVWITPYASVMEGFEQFLSHAQLHSGIYLFETLQLPQTRIDVAKLWNLNAVAEEYKSLFSRLNKEQRRLGSDVNTSYNAKCLILELALIAKKDPQLPTTLMPHNWIGSEAEDWYKKLRAYCK